MIIEAGQTTAANESCLLQTAKHLKYDDLLIQMLLYNVLVIPLVGNFVMFSVGKATSEIFC